MRDPSISAVQFRYFLGFRPGRSLRRRLAAEARSHGISLGAGHEDRLHLTLCVIAETTTQDRAFATRIGAAIENAALASCPVRLGRLRSSAGCVTLAAMGRQDEIRALFVRIAGLLAKCGMVPLHRCSGLHPHITLSHRGGLLEPGTIIVRWIPDELLLIESWVGASRHVVLRRWPLMPPPQGELDFKSGDGRLTHLDDGHAIHGAAV